MKVVQIFMTGTDVLCAISWRRQKLAELGESWASATARIGE
ncbi:hypothetical protein OHA72_38290 [Dactylosporangium sp. NBC_01737]|nr:hypothetical protein OHA72_38290 [Dactylosporangium sp. NBC_01737]